VRCICCNLLELEGRVASLGVPLINVAYYT
jgi:hypothetical protein